MQGWIKLHRRIIDHWIWQDPEYLRMWIYLLLDVNHEERKIVWNKEVVVVKRGEKITSLRKLSMEFNCSREKVRHFLKLLIKDEMCNTDYNTNYTHIKICNYDSYQVQQHTDNTADGHRDDTGMTPGDTNKNDKEGKEGKEELIKSNIELYKKWQSESSNDNYRFFVDYILKLNHTGEPLKYCLQLKGQINEQSFNRLYGIMKKNGTKMTDKIIKLEERLLATNGKSAKDLNLTLGNWLQNKFTK